MMQMLLHGPTRLGRVAGKLRLSHSKSMLRGWLRPTLLSWSASTISRESVHLPINFQPIRPNSTASPATKLHLLRQEFEVMIPVRSSLQVFLFTYALSTTHTFCYTHRQL